MRFGAFLAPLHLPHKSPHLALKRDLELMCHLDALGYDEAWVGEHHSGGVETIASPEIFIGMACERTQRIKLGSGVNSLPYHHPLLVADRTVMLDHLTEGRMMFGAGPGQLPVDARMLGLDTNQLRPRMEESLGVILRLFGGETVTMKTSWFTVQEATLQLLPFSNFDIVVTGSVTPNGAKLAGRHGIGLLTVAGTAPDVIARVKSHWDIMVEESEEYKTSVSRDAWRIMGPIHIAKTFEQAKENCRYGLTWIWNYLDSLFPRGSLPNDYDQAVDFLNSTGKAIIGTPEMAIDRLERLESEIGGFGTFLHMGADFSDWRSTLEHYELFAEEVMPYFTGQTEPGLRSAAEVLASEGRMAIETRRAMEIATDSYEAERKARASGKSQAPGSTRNP